MVHKADCFVGTRKVIMNKRDEVQRQYQCLDCYEIPVHNGICPHGCDNTGEEE